MFRFWLAHLQPSSSATGRSGFRASTNEGGIGMLFCLLYVPSTIAAPMHAAVVLVDDLGYGDTGHMGAEYPTINIDRLALGGIRLNQSYVQMLKN